ncbi:MAG TPA: ribbon-helix-helix protein, CopG family [Candidatus Nanoarchaeia archaeon]
MKTQTINISIPKSLLEKIDKQAETEARSRSELIREVTRRYIENMEEWQSLREYGREVAKKMGIKSEEDVNRLVHEYRHGR